MWKFLVKNQSIEILEREVLADHQIRYVQFKFTFDGDWKKFHKVVQFSQCDEVYSIVLGFDGTTCYLPAELHVGAVKMSVFGYDAASDTTVRATTVPVMLNIRESGFVGDDDTPIPPTPDLYTQLLQKIAGIQAGVDGKDGLSAFEIAKENGFVGTAAEWLESLKGADGLPGKDGRDGVDAMSEDEARLEADAFLSVIKDKQFEFPVYFDVEEKKQFDLGKEKVSAIMRAFLEKIEKAGYFTGLYGSASSLTTHTANDIKSRYTIWLAHWAEQTNYSGAYNIWQYSSEGKVNGISGNVDLDIAYADFPTIIKGKGLNGFGKEQISTPEPDDTIANVTVKIGNETYKGTLIKS